MSNLQVSRIVIVCISSRSTVGHRGLRPNGTTFYQSEIPLLLPPKFPGSFPKWKAPDNSQPYLKYLELLCLKLLRVPVALSAPGVVHSKINLFLCVSIFLSQKNKYKRLPFSQKGEGREEQLLVLSSE